MRNNIIENYKQDGLYRTIKLTGIEKPTRSIIINTEKDKIKFIKKIEMLCRSSLEYRDYIQYLKDYKDMRRCSVFSNLDIDKLSKLKLEIHHEPFTLYDIVNTVVNKYIMLEIPLKHLQIANEVLELHYKLMVGLIPLSLTVHDLFHDGRLFIPIQNVDGDIIKFVREYEDYMPPELKETLVEKIKISAEIDAAGEQDLSILNKHYTYLEMEGVKYNLIKE